MRLEVEIAVAPLDLGMVAIAIQEGIRSGRTSLSILELSDNDFQ